MTSLKTLVLGASTNPARYSNLAIKRLLASGFDDIKAVGLREGKVAGVPIEKSFGPEDHIHTITLYVGPKNQVAYYDDIIAAKPKRIIFNPGTENSELVRLADEAGIETVEACTLVMLSTDQYDS